MLSSVYYPKISIVTPSFNHGQYIEDTILSVLNQNYPNLEYIIIDGGSTDNTVSIIKKYQKYITYWISEPDRGQTHAINKGFEKCTGDVFNWLNSDDYLEPGALNYIGSVFSNPTIDVLAARERRVDEKGNFLNISEGTSIYKDLSDTIGRCHLDQASTYFKKDKLDHIFPLSEDLHYLMDAYMWMKYLLLHGQDNILQNEVVIVNFRMHSDSKTVAQRKKFVVDKNTIENSLLKNLNPHCEVLSELYLRSVKDNFYSEWDIRQTIHPHKIFSHFLLHSIQHLYVEEKYDVVKKALRYIWVHNYDLFRRNNLFRFLLKVMLVKSFPRLKGAFLTK